MGLKFLKWVEIIKAESEAVKRNAMYVLQKDAETCDVIFIDSKGGKRKASGLTLPQIEKHLARIDATNIDTIAQEQWRSVLNLYTKTEVDGITDGLTQAISDEQQARTNADEVLQQSLSDETTARQSADTTLQQNIDAETQARIAGDNNLAQNHSDLQAIVNALQTWKDAMTNTDADNLVNTLNEMLAVMASVPEGTNIYAVLASKVNTADIVNNLTSSLTNAPLSAYQGSVLKGLVDNLQSAINNEATARQNADNTLQNNINAEATARTNADALKVDKTTTSISAPDATFKYAYIFDESNNVRRMLAGDLGKNVANSTLTSVANAGLTLGANWTLNTSGFYYNITNLPDKSSDSTFSSMLVQNAAGQIAKSDGRVPMLKASELFTDAQIDVWRQNMRKTDETYSLGQPRIDFVFPTYINNSYNYIQPLVLYGINLYIDNQTPNSIVQLNRVQDINGNTVNDLFNVTNFEVSPLKTNQIVLMLDWSIYPKGKYKFKVLNGSLQSTVSDGFLILNETVPNNINNLTWTVHQNPAQAENNSNLIVSNKSFSYERKNIAAGITEPTHIMISNEELNGNFVVELNVGLGEPWVSSGNNQNVYNLGLIASSSSSSVYFGLSVLNGFEFKWEWDYGGVFVTDKGYFRDPVNIKFGSGGKMYFLKFQGYITICFITNSGNLILLSSAIAVNEPLKLFNSFYNQGRFLGKTVSFNYGQIFTY